jgi:hypothetical protein
MRKRRFPIIYSPSISELAISASENLARRDSACPTFSLLTGEGFYTNFSIWIGKYVQDNIMVLKRANRPALDAERRKPQHYLGFYLIFWISLDSPETR